jgi:uncharacterized heparinase superfamily protein
VTWGPDRWALYRLALQEAGRAVRAKLSGLGSPARFVSRPRRVLIAPQDLRTSDPTVAEDIYAGLFVLAGRSLSTGGRSPFDFTPPSPGWGEALYAFGWLRHLRGADTALARANARALVDDFLLRRVPPAHTARQARVVARRLIAFLAQSPLLLEGADYAFYQRFLRAVGQSVRDVDQIARSASQPLDRLTAAIALCYAALCCEGLEPLARRATRNLARELEAQLLADGGHIGRNPQAVVELALDLLPLRQTYAGRGLEPPPALMNAIDRILPFIRLLRHEDGTLSHMNGVGATPVDHVATLLMYEGARGPAMRRAPHSGYERLEAGGTMIVADVGPAPPEIHGAHAHAGCLSFEMSSARQRIVVNCGAAPEAPLETRLAARSTAAHSTAVVAETSSARFLVSQGSWPERLIASWLIGRFDHALIRGPRETAAEREEHPEGALLRARHDGYRMLGFMHERHWRLAAAGDRLDGEDRFTRSSPQGSDAAVAVRFHLAPVVKASRVESGRAIMLVLPNREVWRFEVEEVEAALEESVFFAMIGGMRRTEQIVLSFRAAATPIVRWSLQRVSKLERAGRPASAGEPEPLL